MYNLLLLLLLVTCCSMGSKPPVKAPMELPPIVVTPGEYLTIRKCTNCSEKEWKFIQDANVKTNETVATTCFASFMLERKLIDTLGKSNAEVVDSLVGKNTVIDVEMYYTLKRVLGYTLADQPPGQYKEFINRKYMLQWNVCDLGSLLGHETGHKKGYGHAFNYTPSRDYSVPYSINAAFKKCCVR